MNCKNCGTELKPGARFCHRCGTPADEAPVRTPAPAAGSREVERLLGYAYHKNRMGMPKATGTLVLYEDHLALIKIKGAFAKKALIGGIVGNIASQYGDEDGIGLDIAYTDIAAVEAGGSMMTNHYIQITPKNGDKIYLLPTFNTGKNCRETADKIRRLAGL